MRRLFTLIGPEGILLALALVWGAPLEARIASTPYALPALLGAGALLSWRFRRSRILFALLLLSLAALLLPHLALEPAPGATTERSLAEDPAFQTLALLLPLNLGVLTLLAERGVLTRLGLLRMGVVALQGTAVLAIAYSEPAELGALLDASPLPARFAAWTPLAQPALLAFAFAFALAAVRQLLRPDPVTRGILWALPPIFLALDAAGTGDLATAHFATAALVLGVAIVESSFAMAYRDGLTGLPSRRAFNEEILKLDGQYTIAMVDVDHFKKCNDRHGHDVGDQVLRMVAARLDGVGGGGRPFRYGGEEFSVLFPWKGRLEAMPYLERLREAIEATPFTVRSADRPSRAPAKPAPSRAPEKKISVTVSIGVAERSRRHADPEAVIKAADKALYRAKKEGRNRVVG